ncbi:MAG: TlpA family protein disulfide reductase [Chloroflexi bacterium]|nr:TlpA family protein disulfide reductase [Chloroflexota bacterium]
MSQSSAAFSKKTRGKKQRNRKFQQVTILVITVSLVGWLIWNATQGTSAPVVQRVNRIGTQIGEIAPDFTISILDGSQFTLSASQGKPTIVFFMAYWCGACIPEAQALAQLKQEYGNDLNIVAIDLDPSSSTQALLQFKQASGNGEYIWGFDFNQQVTTTYLVRSLDTTLILDAEGYVIFRDERPTDYNTLKNALESLES